MEHSAKSEAHLKPEPHRDWPGIVCSALLLAWISGVSLAAHGIAWVTEQVLAIQGLEWPAAASLGVGLGQGLLVAVPSWILALLWKQRRYRAVFQTWAVGSLSVFLLLPVRLVRYNKALTAGLWQVIGGGLYLALVAVLAWQRRKRGGPGFVRPQGPYAPAWVFVPLLTAGWIAWGALGSLADVVANVTAAAVFGLSVGLTAGHLLLRPLRQTSPGQRWDLMLGGIALGALLLLTGSGFGFNGQQLLLMVALPALGLPALGLSYLGRKESETGWLAIALVVGLVVAAAMLLVDPDELALVLNLGSRDVLAWSAYCVLATTAAGWLIGISFLLASNHLSTAPARTAWRLLAALAWLAIAVLYVGAGQPGLHGDQLFVVLRDQAPIATGPQAAGPVQRRELVYRTLVEHAGATQADIRAVLDRIGIEYTPYYVVNSLKVNAGPLVRLWLETHPQVDRVLDCPVLRPLPAPIPPARGSAAAPSGLPWNLTSIGADRVWRELGITGEGIVIGQSDSGVQWDHPELKAAYRGDETGSHDYNWLDPWHGTLEPTDISGHGTHTLASIVGSTVGVAPGATWYGCANLARNLGNPAYYLDCMQFMLAPFPMDGDPFTDGEPTLGAHVINNSWGCDELEGCDPGTLEAAVRALRGAGIFVVASAGNEGAACGSISSPIALYDEAFSVGAIDSAGRLAFFSSRGPVLVDGSYRTKPDVVAPGVNVLSAYPGNTYEYVDGTSMAGPHVAGVVALIWSANPALLGDIEATESILAQTARPYDTARLGLPGCAEGDTYPNNAVGYGLVDAYAAVAHAMRPGAGQ